jgi:hypothetical protein
MLRRDAGAHPGAGPHSPSGGARDRLSGDDRADRHGRKSTHAQRGEIPTLICPRCLTDARSFPADQAACRVTQPMCQTAGGALENPIEPPWRAERWPLRAGEWESRRWIEGHRAKPALCPVRRGMPFIVATRSRRRVRGAFRRRARPHLSTALDFEGRAICGLQTRTPSRHLRSGGRQCAGERCAIGAVEPVAMKLRRCQLGRPTKFGAASATPQPF